MPKIVGTRERIHQPFYDSLIRVDGQGDMRAANVGVFGAVQSRSQLFTKQGADIAVSNLTTGGFFPSDQTFVTLAVRVWTYFRFNFESARSTQGANQGSFAQINAGASTPVGIDTPSGSVFGDRTARVHKLYHQTQNQLFWQFQAGDKPQLTTYTAYTPFAGGLDGFFSDSRLPRANNGLPSSSALMRLARPILIPPRQGFVVIAIASPIGQAGGADVTAQLNGLVPNNDIWGDGPQGTISSSQSTAGTGLSVAGKDDIEKDVKYLIDGIHSRDVL
jgi:hypothetical protein